MRRCESSTTRTRSHAIPTRSGLLLLATTVLGGDVLAPPAKGGERAVLLEANSASVDLADHASVLEDCSGGLSVGDLETPAVAGRFQPAARHSFGYTRCALWVRVDLDVRAQHDQDWLLVVKNPRVDHVDLFRDGRTEHSGNAIAFASRPVRSRYPVFDLGHLPAGQRRFYLRLQTSDVAAYPLYLMRPGALNHASGSEHLLLGGYFGIMLVAALWSAVVFAFLRDGAYLLYALFLVSYTLFEAAVKGLDIEYLWPEHPWWNMAAIPIFCGLTILCGALFSARFLMLRRYAPVLRHVANGVGAAGAVMIAVTAAGAYTVAGILGSALAPLCAVILGFSAIVVMMRGSPQAKHFLLAGSLQFLGVVLNGFRNFGLLPATFIPTYGGQIGSTFFVLLVSIALMGRFELLRREKERAQEEAMESRRAASDAKRVTAELRLQALQAKINPHFLYNTLNTIAGLIAEAPARAQGVVVRLSRLFRYTLTATDQERVPITEELNIVRSYLEIEQERFGERLKFDIQTHGAIEGLTIPGLTIQPLVENCVKHGLRPKVDGGQVWVVVGVADEWVHILVEDNGVGMDTTQTTDGHGLHSVRERLRLTYRGAATMKLTSEHGLRVEITIPAMR